MNNLDTLRAVLQKEKDKQFQIALGFAGAGVTGESKVVANAFRRFGVTSPSEDVAKVLSKTPEPNTPLAKSLQGIKDQMLKDSARIQQAEAQANSIARSNLPNGNPKLPTSSGIPLALIATRATKPATAVAAVGVGAVTAGIIPDISTPEKRLEQAVKVHQPVATTPSVMQDKKNVKVLQQEAKQSPDSAVKTQVRVDSVLQAGDTSKPRFSSKDLQVVVKSDQPGQTIYRLSDAKAKELGFHSPLGVYTNIPNDIPFSHQEHLDNPALVQASIANKIKELSNPDTAVKQAVDNQFTVFDHTRDRILQDLQAKDKVLQDYQALLAETAKYPNDPRAQDDARYLNEKIAARNQQLFNQAGQRTVTDPHYREVIKTAEMQQKAKKTLTPDAQYISKSLTDQTDLQPNMIMHLVTGINGKLASAMVDKLNSGDYPNPMAVPLGAAETITLSAYRKRAIHEGQDAILAQAQTNVIHEERQKLLDALAQGQAKVKDSHNNERVLTLDQKGKLSPIDQADFNRLLRTTVQTKLLSNLYTTVLAPEGVQSIEELKGKLQGQGKTPDEIRNTISKLLADVKAGPIEKSVGLTDAIIQHENQAQINKLFPSGLLQGLFDSFLGGA